MIQYPRVTTKLVILLGNPLGQGWLQFLSNVASKDDLVWDLVKLIHRRTEAIDPAAEDAHPQGYEAASRVSQHQLQVVDGRK